MLQNFWRKVSKILLIVLFSIIFFNVETIGFLLDDIDLSNFSTDSTTYGQNLYEEPTSRFTSRSSAKNYYRDKYLPKDIRSQFQMDSSSEGLTSRQTFDSLDVNYPYNLPLETYLNIQKRKLQNGIWDSLISYYDLKSALTGRDLSRMLSASTGLTIPVPPNPIIGLFGKPEININVSGEINLRAGWRFDSQNLGTVSAFGQTQSSPIFSQDIRVNVNGRIGDKLRLGTDWNTRKQFDYENKFKISYEGEDDDIIKLIEVGNVSLPTTSSLIGGSQALFGVRADFQFGPLYLKTLLSQKRGERKWMDVRGGTGKQPFTLRAYDYAKNHFFLDTAYKTIYKDYFKYSTPIIPVSSNFYRVKEIQVWESTNDVRNGSQSGTSVAFANIPGKKIFDNETYDPSLKKAYTQSGEVERGNFMLLDSNSYTYDCNLGTLTIFNLRQDRYYAVAYRIEGNTTEKKDDIHYGTILSQKEQNKIDTMLLKLIYRPNLQPGFKTLWARQMKNIYSINATNVNISDTKIGLWYINQQNDSSDVLPGAPDKLVTIMRVDQVNNQTGNAPADGQFDLRAPFFDATRGEITFPSVEPFREGLREYFTKIGSAQIAEKYVYNEIYDTTYDVARRNTSRDRFIVSGEVSGKASNRISLNAFNLAPNSVKVTLNGVTLREYEDYVIDYYSGQLTIRNTMATLPNANLRIEYESQDIFNIATKTLAGLRADYQLIKSRQMNAFVGFTGMYYNQSAVIDRVRLGEEPVSNLMIGFDAKAQWDLPQVTEFLDAIPFYDTKVQSQLTLKGEWALMMPEPNKRRSEVTSDNGEAVVYIDDFEGAQRYISLGLTPAQWQHCSPPYDPYFSYDSLSYYRGKTYWYQYFLPRVPIKEVYPERSTVIGQSNLSPMYITFDPYERGIYNKNAEFLDKGNTGHGYDSTNLFTNRGNNKETIWGGMQRLFSSFNTNFDTENIEYIEIMMKIDEYEPGKSKLFIDLGQISEDVIPNEALNTEDGITEASPIPNNIIDAGEDIGIDELIDANEKVAYPYPLNQESDPARDNYAFNFGKDDNNRNETDFKWYNNFEGNASVSEMGQFPDTEILNDNNGQSISLDNSYFSYEVALNPDPNSNSQIVGGGNNGWYLYRIPIRKPDTKVGTPLFSNIQYARIRYKGGLLRVSIVEWRLVGSYWQRQNNIQSNVPENDSVLSVAFVNVEENGSAPDYYTMPPGVAAPRQINNPDPNQDVKLNEQSLALGVKNLRYGDERIAVRYFRPMDVFYYKTLKFFIHGDGSIPDNYYKGAVAKAYAYIRFGTDSSNYYEYRKPLIRGWQSCEIKFSELTSIKQTRDSLMQYQRVNYPVPNDEYAMYAIRGNPVLTSIQFVGFGISNPAGNYPNELTTTMWVDELRLLSPEDKSDWAAVANADFKLADLGTINATINYSKPNFHKLEERFGNRMKTTNWTVTMQGNLDKFAKSYSTEFKLPISYTHSEYMQSPEYVANSDINLEQAAIAVEQKTYTEAIKAGKTDSEARQLAASAADATRVRSQTLKVQDAWAVTGVKLGIPVKHWLVRETFNRLTFGYSYSQEFERSPVVQERFNWIWQMTAQYAVNISDFASVKPMGWAKDMSFFGNYSEMKVNFFPNAFSANLSMLRRRQTEQSRYLEYPSPVIRDFTAARQGQFNWRLIENSFLSPAIDYSVSTSSTLVPFELDEEGRQRTGSQIASRMLLNDGQLIDFGTNNSHTQIFTLNIRPKLPIAIVNRYLEMTGSFSTTYNWQNPLQADPKIHDVAKTASWNNTIRYSTGFKLKSLADDLFNTRPVAPDPKNPTAIDSNSAAIDGVLAGIGKTLKFIFMDFEKVDINFNQTNSSQNPGVFGGTGFDNVWSFHGSDPLYGPGFAYQFGLVSNPHGGFSMMPSSSFPFFKFQTYTGKRPANAILQDNFSQRTTLEAKTSRPLWEGATLELNWRTELGFNKNQTVITDSMGFPTFSNIVANESFSRTFLCLPSFFGLDLFNNNIEHIIDLYKAKKPGVIAATKDSVMRNQNLLRALSESFHDGLEAFSFFKGAAGKFLPALNWAIRWEGIEKWGMWNGLLRRVTVEHVYTSKYTENAQTTDNGKVISGQQVQMGFQPFVGISASFDDKKLKGTLTASLRYNKTSTFMLTAANSSQVSKQDTDELQVQGSYTLRGFSFPLFGIDLKNDVEFSFLGSVKKNRRSSFDVTIADDGTSTNNGTDGRTIDGNTQITLEPRAGYKISNIVSASFFIRYDGTFTEGAASPGYTTFQVGLDLRISISGGR